MVAVGNLWRQRGARLAYEVPIYEHFLDMVAVQNPRPVVAVELKVRDWRRAIKQAVVAQLAADEVYIALWHVHVVSVDRLLLDATGVGLISVDEATAAIVVPAQPSRITITHHRDAIATWVKLPNQARSSKDIQPCSAQDAEAPRAGALCEARSVRKWRGDLLSVTS